MIGTGDVMVSRGGIDEHSSWLNAVLPFHLRQRGRIASLNRKAAPELDGVVPNLLYRSATESSFVEWIRESAILPLPRYDLIPMHKYRIPHGRRKTFASFLTDFGCPYTCSFCFNGKWDHKLRDQDNAMQELRYIRQLGIPELWIKDLTFGVNRRHSFEFLNRLIDEKLNFDWITLSRVDVMDEEMLTLMARAGCHTIQFGVESSDQQILNSIEKGIAPERVKEVFQLCRKLGIRTLAHFILGLPGETEQTALNTIMFAREIDPDFASFNVAAPRMGTDLRSEAIRQGWTDKDADSIDNSVALPQMNIGTLTPEQVHALRTKAIREFHLRPEYIIRKVRDIQSPREFWRAARNGYTLLKSTLQKPTLAEAMESDM